MLTTKHKSSYSFVFKENHIQLQRAYIVYSTCSAIRMSEHNEWKWKKNSANTLVWAYVF